MMEISSSLNCNMVSKQWVFLSCLFSLVASSWSMADKDTSGDDSSVIDVQLNPFHLHYSYSSSAVLVTQPLVEASNYSSWCKAMLIGLSGKNKEWFIDGSIKKLEFRWSTSWKCNNDIITSWILNSISKEIASNINYIGSAKVIWDELHSRFKQSNGPLMLSITQRIGHHKSRRHVCGGVLYQI